MSCFGARPLELEVPAETGSSTTAALAQERTAQLRCGFHYAARQLTAIPLYL